MFKELQGFVEETRQNPFFIYWGYTIPHAAHASLLKNGGYYKNKFGKENPT